MGLVVVAVVVVVVKNRADREKQKEKTVLCWVSWRSMMLCKKEPREARSEKQGDTGVQCVRVWCMWRNQSVLVEAGPKEKGGGWVSSVTRGPSSGPLLSEAQRTTMAEGGAWRITGGPVLWVGCCLCWSC